jgi:hypothetical protein
MREDRYRVEFKDEESGGLRADCPAGHGNCRRTLMPDFFAGLSNSRMLSKGRDNLLLL